MHNLNNTFLQDEENVVPQDKVSFSKYQLKIKHLNDLNKKLYLENSDLKTKINSLQQQNNLIFNQHIDEDSIIHKLRLQLQDLKNKNSQLSKQNEQLLANILLDQQLGVETRKEANFHVSRYQQKILELRQNLQMKQLQVQSLQDRYQKFKFLQLPMNVKNNNRFTAELLKYEILIEELIEERNSDSIKDLEEINRILPQLNSQESSKNNNKIKNQKNNVVTDVRPNLVTLSNQSPYGQLNQEKLDVIFLRLHFELRTLKKKYRERLQEIAQLKSKDKIMKQGYNTLTKEMQKVRNNNCQLNIQLQHLTKKIQTTKELSRAHSVGNIQHKKVFFKQNAQSRICSQVSIEGNCSLIKQKLKGNLPSQTKYDTLEVTKSHNFDQKIENIEGILSLDSNPDFSDLINKKMDVNNDSNDEELSVCEENSIDMSISLDASGFQAPERSHHEISEHILRGLIDKRCF